MIEHLKSGLSLSTHMGCPMGCSYCILSKMQNFKKGPQQCMTPEEIMDELKSENALFSNGDTPLIINNRTDPFLPAVVSDTIRLLDMLAQSDIKSPVILISKFPPTVKIRKYFDILDLMYIYSYSNIKSDFNYENLERDLEMIDRIVPKSGRFHYFRPVIEGYNDDIEEMLDLIKVFYRNNFRGSIITGLRVTSDNVKLIGEDITYDAQHKIIREDLYAEILKRLNYAGINYEVYRHTSCAISVHSNRKNNLLYVDKMNHCNSLCDNYVRCKDNSESANSVQITAELKKKFGNSFSCSVQKGELNVESPISQEQIAYIRNAYGIKVYAKKVLLSPSEKEILSN